MIVCQKCGLEAQTRYVEFYQNVGLLVLRLHKDTKGHLCKTCINKTFWVYTVISLIGGWWGIISLCLNPFILINNVYRYMQSLGMEPPHPDATAPVLTIEVAEKIMPFRIDLVMRVAEKEPLESVARDIAQKAGVTTGQVLLYITHIAQAA
jgi:hypothetical protein